MSFQAQYNIKHSTTHICLIWKYTRQRMVHRGPHLEQIITPFLYTLSFSIKKGI